MHMWHHVTNHLIISTDKDSNSENQIKLRVRDNYPWVWHHGNCAAGGQGQSISKRCKAVLQNTMFFFFSFQGFTSGGYCPSYLNSVTGKILGGVRMLRLSKGHGGM
jgi:hypothetical protein